MMSTIVILILWKAVFSLASRNPVVFFSLDHQKHVHAFFFPAARSTGGQVPPPGYDVLRAMDAGVTDVPSEERGLESPAPAGLTLPQLRP